jgi:hypothetical protein
MFSHLQILDVLNFLFVRNIKMKYVYDCIVRCLQILSFFYIQKPPMYVKIKSNKPVGNVRVTEMDLSSMTPCDCDPNSANPCGPDTDCLNR